MLRRRLGRTDLDIAPLVLGGNVFGWTADEKASFAVLDRFVAAGFNAIDTANNYSRWVAGNVGGESETIIGEWMKDRRNRKDVVIITKVGSDVGQGKRDLSAVHIEKAIEESLKRLQTDVIDVYMSHWHVLDTPYEETLHAFQRLIEKGKVRFVGASNHTAAQFGGALKVAAEKSLPHYDVLEPEYNLYDRAGFEGSLQMLCLKENIGAIVYYALAKGFLSGKYRSEADLKGARAAGVKPYFNRKGFQILAALDKVAERQGANVAEVALAWTIAQPGVTAPIASATRIDQIESLTRSATIKLDAEDLKDLDVATFGEASQ